MAWGEVSEMIRQGEHMNRKQIALDLVATELFIFPLVPGGTRPAFADWRRMATRDPARIERWWRTHDFNVGISTSRFGNGKALAVIEIDRAHGGYETVIELQRQGLEFSPTMEVSIHGGSKYLIYQVEKARRQGRNLLGKGLHVHSRGGYIVGPGSVIDDRIMIDERTARDARERA
jgi:hypothetical protein